MTKAIWHPGTPEEDGVYWFDTGLRFHWESKSKKKPMILHVRSGKPYLYGDYGSGPLHMYYSAKLCPDAVWAYVEEAETWTDGKAIPYENSRAWVKDPEGHLGFTLCSRGSHDDVRADILWIDKPNQAAGCGMYIRNSEGYTYSLLEVPNVPIKKDK